MTADPNIEEAGGLGWPEEPVNETTRDTTVLPGTSVGVGWAQ